MLASKFWLRSLMGLACVTWNGVIGAAAENAARPNIVLIVADDLGYGDLGFLGGKDIPTPRIDTLARSGVNFSSGYVSCPVCSPTRAGLLTGRYQQRFGHEFNPDKGEAKELGLDLAEQTLPQQLKQAGYSTGLVGKWHLGVRQKYHPLERGFDEFFGFLGGSHPYLPGSASQPRILRGRDAVEETEYLTDAFAREAVAYIDRHKERPFFLYLACNAVHNPPQAKPEHLKRFASISDKRRRVYAGMLTALDDAVGCVLDKLQTERLQQNTLIIFISDNGGPTATGSTNGQLNGQKATTWEGGIRVPFLLSWPGRLPSSVTYDQPVIQLDLFPTILAAAGARSDPSRRLDGVNLLPYLNGERSSAPHDSLYWRFGEQIALRQGGWKLLKVRGDERPRLFNLRTDIGEQHDLASENPELVRRLQADWDAWSRTLIAPRWPPGAQQADRNRETNP